MAGKTSPLAAPLALALTLALPLPAAAEGDALPEIPNLAGPYLAAEAAARRSDVAAAARWYAEALEAAPESQALLSKAIVHHVSAGRMEEAVAYAERLEAVQPDRHLGVLVLAVEALRTGDPGRARALLAGTEESSGPFVGQLIAAWAAFADGDTGEARRMLTRLGEKGNAGQAGEIVAGYHLALLEAAAGNEEVALAAIDRTIERAEGTDDRLTRVRAGILARLGRVEEAGTALAERIDATLGDARLESIAGGLAEGRVPTPLVSSGTEGAAEALYGVAGFLARSVNANPQIGLAYARLATHLDPALVQAWLLIGDILDEQGQHELAIAAYEQVPRDAPEALEAAIGRARALEAAERRDEAIGVLREIAAAHPRALEAHLALGDALRRGERWAEAAEAYDAAVRLIGAPEQRHWSLYYQRGIVYERSDQWEKAEADFLKALELQPEQPLVLNYLGYSWVEQRKNLDRAQEMIETAVDQRPEDGFIVDSLGWVKFRLGAFEEAAKHLERAVELQPTDPIINDHFGDALWMIGRKTEARFQWKRALSFEPEEDEAERIRKKLRLGLDAVLAEEEARGEPAVVKSTAGDAKANGG